jgi:hypothetical protein
MPAAGPFDPVPRIDTARAAALPSDIGATCVLSTMTGPLEVLAAPALGPSFRPRLT